MIHNGSIMSELSEINKPTQLADKYTKLYETEWTDAYNILTLDMIDQRTVIEWLLNILKVKTITSLGFTGNFIPTFPFLHSYFSL